jgi:aarF domain-containing kinase
MDYLAGVALTDLAAVSQVTDVPPDEVLINALNTWFLSLTMCPTFHADVHAGLTPPPPLPFPIIMRHHKLRS